MPIIKCLSELHVSQYRSLRIKSLRESPYAFSDSYEDILQKPKDFFLEELKTEGNPPEQFVLGAFNNTELIGFVKFRRDKRTKARHKAMVHAMYTDPTFRKQGVGKMLIANVLSRVKQMDGLEQIHLWVLHATISASDFYLKCGFESQGTIVKKDLKIGEGYVDSEYMVWYGENEKNKL